MLIAGGEKLKSKLALICVFLSILPDVDVIFHFAGVPYESEWGHRGFTHSLAFALICGIICTLFFPEKKKSVFLLATLSTFSHPLSDMLTDGGLGVALWWPFDTTRYFFPLRPVRVSPIGVGNFIGWRGVQVLVSEILVLWIPLIGLGLLSKRVRR